MYAARSSGVTGLLYSTIGGTGTSAKIFPALGKQVPSGSVTSPLQLLIPSDGTFEGQSFTIEASGNVTFGSTASPTINFLLQSGSSLTSSSNTTVVTLAAALSATASKTYPFSVRIRLQGDSASGIVQVCYVEAFMDNATMGTTTNTALSSVNFLFAASTGENPIPQISGGPISYALSLVFGLTFGVSDASNAANLMSFQLA